MHDRIVHREAEQDGREAHTDDVDDAKNQSAERERRGENQREQSQKPEHRLQAPVREPE